MEHYILIYQSCGSWFVYHNPDGTCIFSNDCLEEIISDVEEAGLCYFALDVNVLCDPDAVDLHEATYDWR